MAAMLGSDLKSRMAREVRQLAQTPPEGVKYVETDADALTEVHADLTGPEGTPYAGAVFRLKLVIGSEFPSAPPRGFFLTKIFHPNVATNGDICVNTLKRDWKPETTLSHILQVIRCLLIVPFPESSLNDEAGKLFMTSYEQYAQRARLMTDLHAPQIQPPARAATPTALGDNNGESQPGPDAAALEKQKLEVLRAKAKAKKKKGLKAPLSLPPAFVWRCRGNQVRDFKPRMYLACVLRRWRAVAVRRDRRGRRQPVLRRAAGPRQPWRPPYGASEGISTTELA